MNMKKLLATAMVVPLRRGPIDAPNQLVGLPVCVKGPPGSGKSETIESLGEEMTMLTHTVFIPSVTSEDLGGYPVQDGAGKLVRMCDDPIIHELKALGEGLVFLDEINTNRQNIYASLLSVLLCRRYGGLQLGGGVRFMAAMNGDNESVGSIPLPPPIVNRMCHINWDAGDEDQFLDYLLEQEDENATTAVNLHNLTKRRNDNWPAAWGEYCGKAAGFLRANRGKLHLFKDGEEGPWASRRTWVWGFRAMATAKALKAGEEIRTTLLRGCVGDAVTKEFLAWERNMDLPTSEEVVKNGFTPDKARIDRSMAVYESLSTYVANMPKGPKQVTAATSAWNTLNEACKAGLADTISKPAKRLVTKGLGLSAQDEACAKAASPVLTRIQPMLAKADAAAAAHEGL